MNISASTASRNTFSKGHVHKHPLWRIKIVVLGFLTNKNNHCNKSNCWWACAAKQTGLYAPGPLQWRTTVGALETGWKVKGQEEMWTSDSRNLGRSLLFYLKRWRPWIKRLNLSGWVSVSSWLRGLSNFGDFYKTFQTNDIRCESYMGKSISWAFRNN